MSGWCSDVCSSDFGEDVHVADLGVELDHHVPLPAVSPACPRRSAPGRSAASVTPTARTPAASRMPPPPARPSGRDELGGDAHRAHQLDHHERERRHAAAHQRPRSAENTTELHSLMPTSYAVFCLKTTTDYK